MESSNNRNFQIREDLFTKLPSNSICVEVGTRFGDLAYAVIEARPDLKLTVVDNWEGPFAEAEQAARQKLGNKVRIMKATSVNAARHLEDESLDLVYIDAAHDWVSVREDLDAWWPKVKRGGIMAWHDHENKPDDGFWGPIEVLSAVTDWAKIEGLKINIVEPNSCPSGWVLKP